MLDERQLSGLSPHTSDLISYLRPDGKEERNLACRQADSNERHTAHRFFAPGELFWRFEKLCADAGAI